MSHAAGAPAHQGGADVNSSIRLMSTVAPALRLRGRAAEIAVLSEALDRAASGQPAVVLIEGEAGIGKTRLLAEAQADARGRGMQVAAGRAEELEQTRPFGLVARV
jgi:predicted ATPase